MRDSKLFYTSILSFFVGTAGYFIFETGIFILVFLGVIGALSILLATLLSLPNRFLILLGLIGIFYMLGGMRASFVDDARLGTLDNEVGVQKLFEGIVITEPREREKYKEVIVRLSQGDKVRLVSDMHLTIEYGDRLHIKGSLDVPKTFVTDTGRVFDYVSYLRGKGIAYQMFYPEINILEVSGGGNKIKKILFGIKNSFLHSLERGLPEPHSSLAGGITVGADDSLGSDLEDDLRKTGIIHIVVLSGYNVTIVSEFFMKVFSALPLLWKSVLGVGAIFLFMIMTGASATIVRASIMAGLLIFARVTGRNAEVVRLLFLAGFIMVIINPFTLLYDPSFQLSFLATLGLVVWTPYMERYWDTRYDIFSIRSMVIATLATQIMVLPLLLYMTGEVSLVALFVNILVLPLIPLGMLGGLVVGSIGIVSGALAFPFAFIEYSILEYMFTVVDFFKKIPFASVSLADFSLWWMFLVYALYGVIFWYIHKKKPDM